MQLGQHQRVSPIRLDPVTLIHRDQRRSYDNELMAVTPQQSMKSIAARSRFVAETEPTTPIAKLGRHLDQDLATVLEYPDVPNLAAAAALCDGYRDGRLVHVQSNKSDI